MPTEMYPPLFNEPLRCTSAEALQIEMQRFTDAMSFDYFSVVGVVDEPRGTSFHNLALKVPDQYLKTYLDVNSGKNSGKTDPVMQRLKIAFQPMWWDEAFYANNDQRDKWEAMAGCGMRSGAVLALHMPAGRHLIVGMDQTRQAPINAQKRQATLAALTLFSTYVAEAALCIMGVTDRPVGKLTKQEIECLKWRGEGKSCWVIGQFLNLSESRVRKVCASASEKLGCSTTTQAALRAQRRGLLS